MKNQKINKFNINEIRDPYFLKTLSYPELRQLASDIREELLRVTSKNGGHLSSNLGVVELTISLHKNFDFKKDKLIFDVGHQSYVHKILTGRSLENLRKKDGISGFQKISESEFDCFEAGHSSTSISAASGFALARDLGKENFNIISVIGDSSIVSGLALEALNNLSQTNSKVIIILNDNGMSISKPVGALSKMFSNLSTSVGYNRLKNKFGRMHENKKHERFYLFLSHIKSWIRRHLVQPNIFTDMGFKYIGVVDGHDFKDLDKALKRAKHIAKSVIIHVSTIKGKGYGPAENDINGTWHGVSPFDIETGLPKQFDNTSVTWSKVFSELTTIALENNKNAVLLTPATQKGSSLESLFDKYPNRCIDVGIAEEHCVTMCSALSLSGIHPIISIYSTFMQRAYDEISHDICRLNCNSTFLVDRAGLVGNDGETHQGIYDESFLYTIPNVTITMPSNIHEASYLYEESFNNHGPFFIRLPRCKEPKEEFNKIQCEYGKWITLKTSNCKKIAIIGVGPLLRKLEKLLFSNSIDCELINALYIRPIDKNRLDSLLEFENIIIYDPYSTQQGLVNEIMAYLLMSKYKGAIKAYFVNNEFVKQASIDEQLEKYHLLPEQVLVDLKTIC